MITSEMQTNVKRQVSLIIDSLVEIIKNPQNNLNKMSYYYHPLERKKFIIELTIFKLFINDKTYLEEKYFKYKNKIKNRKDIDLEKISNISSSSEIELLIKIKNLLLASKHYYNETDNLVYIDDNNWFDATWLITLLELLIKQEKTLYNQDIKICYAIAGKNIKHLDSLEDKDEFLNTFTIYVLDIKNPEMNKSFKDNSLLIIKNTAINYLKHLKKFKQELETSESFQIFYNLLRNECVKENFTLEEKELALSSTDNIFLGKINSYINEDFLTFSLTKQISIIENIIWKSSNDINLLEHTNNSLDSLIDLISNLNLKQNPTYQSIKFLHEYKDIDLLLILLVNKFLLTYLQEPEDLDYSLINLSMVKPKYMSNVCSIEEQHIRNELKELIRELNMTKRNMEKYKNERINLNQAVLGKDKYQNELERCVGNINRASITIATLNSSIAALNRDYEEFKEKEEEKYRDAVLHHHNRSIIKHLCNSIIGCNFYMKTNNNTSLFENIIVFEDYEKTENAFYLEITFQEFYKISSICLINRALDESDLPKLVG